MKLNQNTISTQPEKHEENSDKQQPPANSIQSETGKRKKQKKKSEN